MPCLLSYPKLDIRFIQMTSFFPQQDSVIPKWFRVRDTVSLYLVFTQLASFLKSKYFYPFGETYE